MRNKKRVWLDGYSDIVVFSPELQGYFQCFSYSWWTKLSRNVNLILEKGITYFQVDYVSDNHFQFYLDDLTPTSDISKAFLDIPKALLVYHGIIYDEFTGIRVEISLNRPEGVAQCFVSLNYRIFAKEKAEKEHVVSTEVQQFADTNFPDALREFSWQENAKNPLAT